MVWFCWQLHLQMDFYPRPICAFGHCHCLCMCVHVCVCVSVVYQSLACPHDNLWPVEARITKFGPEVQDTLVKISLVYFYFKRSQNLSYFELGAFNHYLERFPFLSLCAQCDSSMIKMTLQFIVIRGKEEPLEEPFAKDCFMVWLFTMRPF